MIIVGKMGSGKDTFASMFPMLRRFALADELKKVVRLTQIDGTQAAMDYLVQRTGIWDSRMVDALAYAESHKPVRRMRRKKQRRVLQVVGQRFRDIEPNFWIDLLKDDIELAGNPPHIITDVRYRNEFDTFKDEGSVFVFAPRKVRIHRLMARDGHINFKDLEHVSEKEVAAFCNECDYVVNNSTDNLNSLRRKAEVIIRKEGLRSSQKTER